MRVQTFTAYSIDDPLGKYKRGFGINNPLKRVAELYILQLYIYNLNVNTIFCICVFIFR